MNDFAAVLRRTMPPEWDIACPSSGILTLRDLSLERGRGYSVSLSAGPRSCQAELVFDSFARSLQTYAEERLADEQNPVRRLFSQHPGLTCRVYRRTVERNFDPKSRQEDGWQLTVDYRPTDPELPVPERFSELLLSILLLLLPYDVEAEEEGAGEQALLTRHERSRINRALCLAYHGYDCTVCRLNLYERYGEAARQFIHVHHLNPVATAGILKPDPIRDMVPLCPNCHAVAHRQNPPFTIQELQEMLQKTHVDLHA
jgi:5-methylcytosine-specific restriction protein A